MTDTTEETEARPPHRTARLLQEWLDDGMLDSRVPAWEQRLRTPDRPDGYTWFTKMRDTDGAEVAEAKLAEELAGLEVVTAGIKAVAKGMMAVATVNPVEQRDTPVVYLTRNLDESCFAVSAWAGRDTKTVVVFNPEIPGCGCMQPEGSHLFGRHGLLKLRAVTLSVDTINPGTARLCLVLPCRRKDADDSAFAAAQFDLQGRVSPYTFQPHLYTYGPLMSMLGLQDQAAAWSAMTSLGGDPDDAFGPGCTALLCTNLTNLGAYLTDAADKLSGTHSHSH